MSVRKVVEQIHARPASDGDGVKLFRVFGGAQPERFDPFLLMDEFGSEEASDYIGGFPPHPHRGFETITYMLQGKMEHQDHMGNVGLLNDGDVQWMTAGKGVIHSEMPKQTEGKMRGFQVWLNLPAKNKLTPAKYSDVKSEDIPIFNYNGGTVKALAGNTKVNNTDVKGYFDVPDTDAIYLDIEINPNETAKVATAENLNVVAYTYDGEILIDDKVPASAKTLSRFGDGDHIFLQNFSDTPSRAIVLAGKPLKEPIAHYGPFVMNTHDEINQAIRDYQNGELTA